MMGEDIKNQVRFAWMLNQLMNYAQFLGVGVVLIEVTLNSFRFLLADLDHQVIADKEVYQLAEKYWLSLCGRVESYNHFSFGV